MRQRTIFVMLILLLFTFSVQSSALYEHLRSEAIAAISADQGVTDIASTKRLDQLDEAQLRSIIDAEFPANRVRKLLAASSGDLVFTPVTPACRVLDTRNQLDGDLQSGERRLLNVRGIIQPDQGVGSGADCSIPASARAVSVNIVAVDATIPGNMQLGRSDRATALGDAVINFGTRAEMGGNLVNGVMVELCDNQTNPCDAVQRDLAVQANYGSTHAVINITGYFSEGGTSGIGVPAGAILVWSGNLDSIPGGWALCDGSLGTPDLRGRFVWGTAEWDQIGQVGGHESHSHYVPSDYLNYGSISNWPLSKWRTPVVMSDSEVLLWTNWNTFDEGNNDPESHASHVQLQGGISTMDTSNVPPYVKLAYIMKL